jgi:hypothetical protein
VGKDEITSRIGSRRVRGLKRLKDIKIKWTGKIYSKRERRDRGRGRGRKV